MNERNPYYASGEQNKYTKRRKKFKWRWIFLTFFLVLVLLGAALAFHVKTNMDQFGENIIINTVNVANMTPEQAAEAVFAKMQEQLKTEWVFQREGETFPVEAAQLVLAPENVEDIIQEIWKQVQEKPLWEKIFHLGSSNGQNYPIAIEYNPSAQEQLATQWHEKWNQEPVNATLSVDGSSLTVVPAQVGHIVREEEVFSQLPVYYEDIQNLTIEIPVTIQEAEVTEENWRNVGKLSSYSTNYNPGEVDRTYNMSLAVQKINGTILYSGEEFAFNQVVGERSAAAGYRNAKVISNGAYKPELGGGICQVTSTLYNGVLLADLQIVERHNHALDVSYVPAGRDATVYYGSQDFRFKNSHTSPIYIGMSLGGGTVTVSIYGNMNEKENISISTILDQTIPYPTEYEEDETVTEEKVIQNGMNGKVVRSFRNYLDEAGNILHQEALGKSYYQPMARIVAQPLEGAEAEGELETGMVGEDFEVDNNEITTPVENELGQEGTEAIIDEPTTELEPVAPTNQDSLEDFDPSVDPFGDIMP